MWWVILFLKGLLLQGFFTWEELSFPSECEIQAANSGFSKYLFLWLSDVVGTVNTKLMDILWQSYYCNSSSLAMFSNSPLLCAPNRKCAKMYML